MRRRLYESRQGEERTITKFAFFPVVCKSSKHGHPEERWLEVVKIRQRYNKYNSTNFMSNW